MTGINPTMGIAPREIFCGASQQKHSHFVAHIRYPMPKPPTLIVIAEPASTRRATHGEGALKFFDSLGCVLRRVAEAGLPTLLVCDTQCAGSGGCQVPEEDILRMSFQSNNPADQYVEALMAGIQSRPNASGWLALPCAIPMIQADTLQKVAQALQHYPVAFAEYRQQAGYPIGFSSELFSELMQVGCFRDLDRIIVRYPSHRVEVEDPGVLMAPEGLRRSNPYLDQRLGHGGSGGADRVDRTERLGRDGQG
jgi:molybdenum cofactor cytidylyltransferase